MSGCSLGSAATAIIPATRKLQCADHPWGPKSVVAISRGLGKLAWWRWLLLEFDVEVVHQEGIKRLGSDVRSRLSMEATDKNSLNVTLSVLMVDETEKPQDVDPEYFDQAQPGKQKKAAIWIVTA